jgi:hypothetical protein
MRVEGAGIGRLKGSTMMMASMTYDPASQKCLRE